MNPQKKTALRRETRKCFQCKGRMVLCYMEGLKEIILNSKIFNAIADDAQAACFKIRFERTCHLKQAYDKMAHFPLLDLPDPFRGPLSQKICSLPCNFSVTCMSND